MDLVSLTSSTIVKWDRVWTISISLRLHVDSLPPWAKAATTNTRPQHERRLRLHTTDLSSEKPKWPLRACLPFGGYCPSCCTKQKIIRRRRNRSRPRFFRVLATLDLLSLLLHRNLRMQHLLTSLASGMPRRILGLVLRQQTWPWPRLFG